MVMESIGTHSQIQKSTFWRIKKIDLGHWGTFLNFGFLDYSYFQLFGVTRRGQNIFCSGRSTQEAVAHRSAATLGAAC